MAEKAENPERVEQYAWDLYGRVTTQRETEEMRLEALDAIVYLRRTKKINSGIIDVLFDYSKPGQGVMITLHNDLVEGKPVTNIPTAVKLAARITFWCLYFKLEENAFRASILNDRMSGIPDEYIMLLGNSFVDPAVQAYVYASAANPEQGFTELGKNLVTLMVSEMRQAPVTLQVVRVFARPHTVHKFQKSPSYHFWRELARSVSETVPASELIRTDVQSQKLSEPSAFWKTLDEVLRSNDVAVRDGLPLSKLKIAENIELVALGMEIYIFCNRGAFVNPDLIIGNPVFEVIDESGNVIETAKMMKSKVAFNKPGRVRLKAPGSP
jgi:hypothetical protein